MIGGCTQRKMGADRSPIETKMDVGNMAKDGLWMNIEMYGGMDHGQMDYGQILKWMKVGEHRRMEIVDGY